jgi:fructose-bisphosphate aldolase class II
MTLARTADLVAGAVARRGAVGAFNVVTLDHAQAIVMAAERAGAEAILQLSQNAVRFHGGQVRPVAAACRELALAADVPIAVHLDHVTEPALAAEAAPAGFSSLMFDAGAEPYADNLRLTAAEAARAHAAGLWIEAELGYVGGKPDSVQSAHAAGVRTDPDEAAEFVAATGVDALAVAVGSSHAMLTRTARLDLELIGRLRAAVPVPLVLHGSSGVPDDELRAAVAAGIAKVNVGTALGKAMTAAVRTSLADPSVVDPRTYLTPARAAMADAVGRVLAVLS